MFFKIIILFVAYVISVIVSYLLFVQAEAINYYEDHKGNPLSVIFATTSIDGIWLCVIPVINIPCGVIMTAAQYIMHFRAVLKADLIRVILRKIFKKKYIRDKMIKEV